MQPIPKITKIARDNTVFPAVDADTKWKPKKKGEGRVIPKPPQERAENERDK